MPLIEMEWGDSGGASLTRPGLDSSYNVLPLLSLSVFNQQLSNMNPHSHSTSGLDPSAHHHTSEKQEQQGPLSLSQQINASTREGHDVVNRLIMSRLVLGLQGQYYLHPTIKKSRCLNMTWRL